MWALGVVFTGVSQNFGFLLFARIFTGAGARQGIAPDAPYIFYYK